MHTRILYLSCSLVGFYSVSQMNAAGAKAAQKLLVFSNNTISVKLLNLMYNKHSLPFIIINIQVKNLDQ